MAIFVPMFIGWQLASLPTWQRRETNPSSWQEKLSRLLSYILKRMGERRCIKNISMSSFTAGAQVCDYREPKHFSLVMEHCAVPGSYNTMKTSTHCQYSVLGKKRYGCEEQLSSPMAMQQWQDWPTLILEAAERVHRFQKTVPPCVQKNVQTELNQKSSILRTQILTVQLC